MSKSLFLLLALVVALDVEVSGECVSGSTGIEEETVGNVSGGDDDVFIAAVFTMTACCDCIDGEMKARAKENENRCTDFH